MKEKWTDPEFRAKMLNHSFERTNEWKDLVSEKIKQKWKDPEYRSNVENGIRFSNRTMVGTNYKFSTSTAGKTKKEDSQKLKLQNQIKRVTKNKRSNSAKSMKDTEYAKKSTLSARINESRAIVDDKSNDVLEKAFAELSLNEDELDDSFFEDMDDDDDEFDEGSSWQIMGERRAPRGRSSDLIEVYDEVGNLVGEFSEEEYKKYKLSLPLSGN